MTAYEWNARYPVGTLVRWRPSINNPDAYFDFGTGSKAWNVDGHPVVSLKGKSRAVSLQYLEVLSTAEARR